MRALALSLSLVLAGTGALALTATTAVAQEAAAAYPTYEDVGLTWTRGPSVRDMARFYRTTDHNGRRGLAEVLCTADADGRLDCDILNEDPMGAEFGLAGVRVMERTRVAAVDGGSPAGRTFAFTLRFGNWPPSSIPDRFHPVDQNLLWVDRPSLVGIWGMSGQDLGDRIAATVECQAQADGRLNGCTVVSADSEDFAEAALISMSRARVERADSGRLEGTPLRWTLAVERQSGCGAASSGAGRSGAYPTLGSGASPNAIGADAFGASAGPGDLYGQGAAVGQSPSEYNGGMPGCQAAMVQVLAN